MDGQKPIHHFPTLVYTEAASTFVEKMISNVIERKVMAFFFTKNIGSALVKFIDLSTRVGYRTCP